MGQPSDQWDDHDKDMRAAAKLLKAREQGLKGTVLLLFQPAEEAEGGARHVLESGALRSVSAIHGLHVWPPLKSGMLTTRVSWRDSLHLGVCQCRTSLLLQMLLRAGICCWRCTVLSLGIGHRISLSPTAVAAAYNRAQCLTVGSSDLRPSCPNRKLPFISGRHHSGGQHEIHGHDTRQGRPCGQSSSHE